MFRPGANALDGTLEGEPRDYAVPPEAFGHGHAAFPVRAGQNLVSRRAALAQHELVVRWRASGRSGAKAAERWGFSRQTWSRIVTGARWAGHLGWAALTEELAIDHRGAMPVEAVALVAQGHAAATRLAARLRHEVRTGPQPDAATLRQLAQLTAELGVLLDPNRLRDLRADRDSLGDQARVRRGDVSP